MKLVLGDNPFFGIKHSGHSKGLTESEFDCNKNVVKDIFDQTPLDEIMVSAHEKFEELFEKIDDTKLPSLNILIPLPQRINKDIAQSGFRKFFIQKTNLILRQILFRKIRVFDAVRKSIQLRSITYFVFNLYFQSEISLVKDVCGNKLRIKRFGLHNLMTDTAVAGGHIQILKAFGDAVALNQTPPLYVTQNCAFTCESLKAAGICNAAVCFSYNQLGYMVNPNKAEVNQYIQDNDNFDYWAMMILAGGNLNTDNLYVSEFRERFSHILIASSNVERIKGLICAFED